MDLLDELFVLHGSNFCVKAEHTDSFYPPDIDLTISLAFRDKVNIFDAVSMGAMVRRRSL